MNRLIFGAKKIAPLVRWYATNRIVFLAMVAALVLAITTHCYHHVYADGGNTCGDYSDCHSGPGSGSGGGSNDNS
jgi:hypothetical protein